MGNTRNTPRGPVSEQGNGPGTAHFLLRLCKPRARPSGNWVTVGESPAAGAGFGEASRGPWTRGNAGAGCWRRAWKRAWEQNAHLLSWCGARVPKALSAPQERRAPQRQGRAPGERQLGSDPRGPPGWELVAVISRALLLPHPSHLTRDFELRLADPLGTRRGTGNRRERYAEPARGPTWAVRSPGRAPYRAPPSARLPEAAAGTRLINAKT